MNGRIDKEQIPNLQGIDSKIGQYIEGNEDTVVSEHSYSQSLFVMHGSETHKYLCLELNKLSSKQPKKQPKKQIDSLL